MKSTSRSSTRRCPRCCRRISPATSATAGPSAWMSGGAGRYSSASLPRLAALSSGRSERPRRLAAEAAARVEPRGVTQLLVEFFLPLGQRGGHHDAEIGVEVAGAAARLGQPLAAEPQLFAVGAAARDARADAASIELELALGAVRGFLQADVDIDRVVLSAERHVPRAAKAAAAAAGKCAERLEQVGQVDAAEVLAGVAAEALVPVGRRTEVLPGAVRAEAVEGGALFLVLERLVRLGDLLELLLRVRLLGDVGMVLAGELAVRLLDVLVARAALDAEDLVIVLVLHPLNTERSIASPPPESWNGRGRGWSRCPAAGR